MSRQQVGFSEIESLKLIDSDLQKQVKNLFGSDKFGNDLDAEIMRKLRDGAYQYQRFRNNFV